MMSGTSIRVLVSDFFILQKKKRRLNSRTRLLKITSKGCAVIDLLLHIKAIEKIDMIFHQNSGSSLSSSFQESNRSKEFIISLVDSKTNPLLQLKRKHRDSCQYLDYLSSQTSISREAQYVKKLAKIIMKKRDRLSSGHTSQVQSFEMYLLPTWEPNQDQYEKYPICSGKESKERICNQQEYRFQSRDNILIQ